MSPALVRMLAGGIALASLSVTSQAQEPRPILDRDSYAVFASVVSTTLSNHVYPNRTVIIRRETVPASAYRCLPTGKTIETDWKAVMDSFLEENRAGRIIQEGFEIGVPYVTAPGEKLGPLYKSLLMPSEPPRPRVPQPGQIAPPPTQPPPDPYRGAPGVLSFSAVGFDPEKRRALAMASYYCGSLCAHYGFHLLEKTDGQWKLVHPPNVNLCMAVA